MNRLLLALSLVVALGSTSLGAASQTKITGDTFVIDEANGKEVIRVAIARQKATGKTGLLVKVPLGVRLDTGALIQVDGDQTKAIDN